MQPCTVTIYRQVLLKLVEAHLYSINTSNNQMLVIAKKRKLDNVYFTDACDIQTSESAQLLGKCTVLMK